MTEQEKQSRAVRRRIAREKEYDPRVQFLEEYVFYKKMWPWEKAYYHWLNLKGWCKARVRAFSKWHYVQRWHKKNEGGPGGGT